MSTISVVINTLNSQKFLEDTLESVKMADEIIICDMHSNDETIEIAQKYKCKIFYHQRSGIVEYARNFAINQATSEWVLILDSDEIISPQLFEKLKEYANNPKKKRNALFVPRKNLFLNKEMKTLKKDFVKRFFKKGSVHFKEEIGEKPITIEGRDLYINKNLKDENLFITHYKISSVSEFISKINNYTDFEARKRIAKKRKFSFLKLLITPCFEFVKYFIFMGGFKDGTMGLFYAKSMGYYKFLTHFKMYEYDFKKKHRPEV